MHCRTWKMRSCSGRLTDMISATEQLALFEICEALSRFPCVNVVNEMTYALKDPGVACRTRKVHLTVGVPESCKRCGRDIYWETRAQAEEGRRRVRFRDLVQAK
jgi:hypothetical protein